MRKIVPALARIAFGLRGETVWGPMHTKDAPAAAAVRMRVPRLLGSWMPQANRTSAFCPGTAASSFGRENAPERWRPAEPEHRRPIGRRFRGFADAHVSMRACHRQRLFLAGITKAFRNKDGVDPAAALVDLLQHANPLGNH